jgi:hypothetical protein
MRKCPESDGFPKMLIVVSERVTKRIGESVLHIFYRSFLNLGSLAAILIMSCTAAPRACAV